MYSTGPSDRQLPQRESFGGLGAGTAACPWPIISGNISFRPAPRVGLLEEQRVISLRDMADRGGERRSQPPDDSVLFGTEVTELIDRELNEVVPSHQRYHSAARTVF